MNKSRTDFVQNIHFYVLNFVNYIKMFFMFFFVPKMFITFVIKYFNLYFYIVEASFTAFNTLLNRDFCPLNQRIDKGNGNVIKDNLNVDG